MKEFVVLIGSVARNDFLEDSDIDICRINCPYEISRRLEWPNGPINYIDYDESVFEHLYNTGSLFIYHVLFEGILIQGNYDSWTSYKSQFKVKNDFIEEIINVRNLTLIFKNLEMFGGHYMSLYSNLFTNIKNFSIFYLANKGQFIFNKEQSIKDVFGDFYFELLFDSYNYFDRGIIRGKWDFSCRETATEVTKYYLSKMEALSIC